MKKLTNAQFGKILYQLTQDASADTSGDAIAAFVNLLREHQAVRRVPKIIAAFEQYAKEQAGIVSLHVTTAHPISTKISKKIAETFDGETELDQQVDERVIGGIVIKKGNTIFDASVRGQLDKLRSHLTG